MIPLKTLDEYNQNSNQTLRLPLNYNNSFFIANRSYYRKKTGLTMILQLNGMELSSLPTANHKQSIHIRMNEQVKNRLAKAEKKTENSKEQFEFTSDKTHIKAFVDPSQLSYNSFENILQMDQCFFGPKLNGAEHLNLTIDNMQKINNYFQFQINDPDNILMELHKMDLYTLPFNSLSRGGKRMIFSSIKLADILYQGIKQELEQNIGVVSQKNQLEFDDLHNDFNSVNHVFRLNSFSPSSGSFKSHYDTPFSDSQRKLFSKFTLLIYLTGGQNEQKGCLRINDQKINKIPAFTGIIFDQRHEHEGWPYVEGEKVFLRTQLIYFVKNISEDKRVAQLFNRACYFQKQAYYEHGNNMYADELQKYSNDLFNHTAKLRYSLAERVDKESKENNEICQVERKYLMKKNLNVVYVTDGNSFWFRQSVPAELAAKLVLADYLNGRISWLSSKPADNKESLKIHSKPLKLKFSTTQGNLSNKMQIEENQEHGLTKSQQEQNTIDAQIIEYLDDISFEEQKPSTQYPYDFATLVNTGNLDFDIQYEHCSMEDKDDLTTSLAMEVQSRKISLGRLKTKMHGVGVILFNGKLHIDDNMVKVSEAKGEISFNNAAIGKTINFASCQCQSYSIRQIIGKETVEIEGFYLPKMNYRKFTHCKGYKISIDIFKNGFIHRIDTEISRPQAIDPRNGQIEEPFYQQGNVYIDYVYIDSDSDFDEYTGKRYQEPQEMDEEQNEGRNDDIKKKLHK